MKKIAKPTDNEYALYYQSFIKLVNDDGALLKQLKDNCKMIEHFILSLSEAELLFSYEIGKWTVKDILQHLIDVERIFVHRALRFVRADKGTQTFFDENKFAEEANANKIPIKKLLKDYKANRNATVAFFENITVKDLKKTGYASNTPTSVRACAWIVCGHELHHFNVIKQKYFPDKF